MGSGTQHSNTPSLQFVSWQFPRLVFVNESAGREHSGPQPVLIADGGLGKLRGMGSIAGWGQIELTRV
jgi:hypothetical protein